MSGAKDPDLDGQFGAELATVFNWSYVLGFVIFCLAIGAAPMASGKGYSFGFFFLSLLVGTPFAILAYIPSALIYFPSFFLVFHLSKRVLPPVFTASAAAGIAAWFGMYFAQTVNIDIWPFRVSLEDNGIPDWSGLRWTGAVTSAFVALMVKPGYEIYSNRKEA